MASDSGQEAPTFDEWMDECAGVLMARWGVEDNDEDAYDAAVADVTALVIAGLVMSAKELARVR